jgi:hypothetical protein
MNAPAEDASGGPARREGELNPRLPPFFNPAESARSYAAGAFVLAGFCFAAIVLIIGKAADAPVAYEPVLAALLAAFLGCVVSAFLLALLAGQTHRTERSFWLAGACQVR